MSKYEQLALDLGAINVRTISAEELVFDPRVRLKCIGCSEYGTWRCHPNLPSYQEAIEMLGKYQEILVIHDQDRDRLSYVARTVEKEAFLDGNFFAYALCGCYYCKQCHLSSKGPCTNPDYRRPYCYSLGINVFDTVRPLGLPIQVLQSKDEVPNRYAFVLIK
ncbi:DUF2284 domain-containing protein [Candidatus Formimonas warabiya]|uniref:DUF2284 domain-containing protein n=1 Tax=Formimonas warabiya TaxID=1761012 RepID=A0A3G1L393_FORW1|nr:DUF2284 domain-containing protein [Candidatus Formimonas warabiya]ATW28955.1 hypothetical protein DCMF_27440 [Candidatus Formimonas warabiya]